eukprot:CAMPEP_0172457032 /NCGR_PEP_ID=MMETSP1065-20121228/19522_1 /TAXON_ID=265537 /ORGANISM="Amphiprora paludosa, Strain CCMP125" /LENGTH=119 /DNA_ID=CAMNT_0013210479 /DNA_START=17 /DNA_END=376 /DNA_ORIENTATION=+
MGNSSSSSTPAASSAATTFIDSKVAAHQVVVFSKTYCGYCARTKSLFSGLEQAKDVHVIELDRRSDGDDIQNALVTKTGQRTVPNVFVNKQHVGGNDDVHNAYRNGALLKMLSEWSQQP